MKNLFVIVASWIIALPAIAAGERLSYQVSGADSQEVSAIQAVIVRAAKIAELEDFSAVVSDTRSIGLYSDRALGVSVAARASIDRVDISLSWPTNEGSSVPPPSVMKKVEAIDAFLSKELSARFQKRFLRKEPNQALLPTTTAVTHPAAQAARQP